MRWVVRDDFLDFGWQSLTAVRMLAKVKKKYAVDLKLASLFSAATIEKLCVLVCNQTAPPSFHCLTEIRFHWHQAAMKSKEAPSFFMNS